MPNGRMETLHDYFEWMVELQKRIEKIENQLKECEFCLWHKHIDGSISCDCKKCH